MKKHSSQPFKTQNRSILHSPSTKLLNRLKEPKGWLEHHLFFIWLNPIQCLSVLGLVVRVEGLL